MRKHAMPLISVLGATALVALIPALSACPQETQQQKEEWIPLFNGKDLSGWETFLDPRAKDVRPEDIFTVQDGVIVCDGRVNGYLLTEKEYANYVLKLQWRWGEKVHQSRNSGVFVHVVGENRIWPTGIEAQLMAGHAGDFWLVGDASLKVDPKRRDPRIARHYFRMKNDAEKPIGEWNQYEIVCRGDSVRLIINGQLVNEGTEAKPNKGKILLQSEGAEIHFRDVKLRQLD
jgi:hypothetical protein